jgi:hypothetical protein
MTRDQLRDILERLSPEARGRVTATTIAALAQVVAKRTPSRPAECAPYRSKLEYQYAERLTVLERVGEVKRWGYEETTLVCAGGTKYTVDFTVTWRDGRTTYDETKGYLRDKDAIRMREAAAVAEFPIRVWQMQLGSWKLTRTYHPRMAVDAA